MDLTGVTDAGALKLMHTIVGNVLKHPDELDKYGRINLAGKAGAKLTAAPSACSSPLSAETPLHAGPAEATTTAPSSTGSSRTS